MSTEVEVFEVDLEIIVQAFDVETTLEAFSFEKVNKFFIEYGGTLDPLGQLATAVMDFFETIASALETSIKSAINSVYNSLSNLISNIQSAIEGAIDSLELTLSSAIERVSSMVQSISNSLQSIGNSILSSISSLSSTISSLISSLQSSILSAIGSIQDIVSGITNTISSTINQAVSNLSATLQSISNTIKSSFETIYKTISDTLSQISSSIQQTIQSFSKTVQDVFAQISSSIQQTTEAISNITTTIQNALQSFTSTIQNVFGTIQSTLTSMSESLKTGISSLVTSIQSTLADLSNQLTSAMQSLTENVQAVLQSLSEGITWIREKVSVIPEIPKHIEVVVKSLIQPIFDTIADIPQRMKEIASAFQGFINPLVGIAQFFEQIRSKVVDFLTNVPKFLEQLSKFFEDISKDPLGWFNENVIKPLVEGFSEIGQWIWGQLPDWMKGWFDKIREGFDAFEQFLVGLWGKLEQTLGNPVGALKGFLESVWNVVKGTLSDLVGGAISLLGDLASSVVDVIKDITTKVFRNTVSLLSGIVKSTSSMFWNAISGLVNLSRQLWAEIGKFVSGIISDIFSSMYKNVAQPIENAVLGLIEKVVSGKERGQLIETFGLMGTVMLTFIGSEYLSRGMQIALRKLAGMFSQYEKTFVISVRGRGEAKGEPVGVGAGASAGGGGGFEYTMRFNLGYPLAKIADEMEKYADEYRRGFIYGMTIWASQPMMRLANSLWRNVLPVELPSLAEMRDITRRHMPIARKFKKHLASMRRYLTLYGYNDEVIGWLTTPIDVEGWSVEITDRFGRTRNVPISLLYELPTPSDIARMMIHDLFTVPDKPELAFKSFKTLMSMKGYYEDIAKFYYLLHYKYPSMSNLWEFSCRVVARQSWVSVSPVIEEDLGVEDAHSPEKLMDIYGITKFSGDEVKNKLNEIVGKVLRHYAKWHDYAPFSWIEGWTADNLIYLDLMADIPQRIDARWMYKWKVPLSPEIKAITRSDYFDEKALFLVAVSRGMHPKWIEPIVIAECMNALQEERTYARTGILNTFEEGYMSLDNLNKTLAHLTDVKILGKDVPVRFLEGEVKLLSLRAMYDRALRILRDFFRDLLWGVTENILPFGTMVENLKSEISSIAKSLNLKGLGLDETYFKLYEPVAESLKKVRTVQRIRYWYRYMLYRILYRFSEGFMSKDEFEQVINDIVNNAHLTEDEKRIFTEIAELMYDGFYKKTLADGVLHKVARGVIDTETAKKQLLELGLTEDLADALIEKSAKIYTLSISTLLSYAEYVDIPEDYIKKKLELMGVPKDEVPIILQVFKVKPLRDERAKMIRSVIDAYIDGFITKEQFQQNLKNLGKSDREVEILTEFADFEKSQANAKLYIDAVLNRLRRGAITLEEAKKELEKVIVDKALIDAMIEKYVRTSVWSPDKLVSMGEYVPIDINKVVEKARMFGYPEDEVGLYRAYLVARNLNEEVGRVVNELVYLYVYDIIDEDTLRREIDNVRTLYGEVKKLGVDWIVIDDLEKELIVQRAKLRKMREQYKT